ncbi:unnamed protein product [Camellia sinensis]
MTLIMASSPVPLILVDGDVVPVKMMEMETSLHRRFTSPTLSISMLDLYPTISISTFDPTLSISTNTTPQTTIAQNLPTIANRSPTSADMSRSTSAVTSTEVKLRSGGGGGSAWVFSYLPIDLMMIF